MTITNFFPDKTNKAASGFVIGILLASSPIKALLLATVKRKFLVLNQSCALFISQQSYFYIWSCASSMTDIARWNNSYLEMHSERCRLRVSRILKACMLICIIIN